MRVEAERRAKIADEVSKYHSMIQSKIMRHIILQEHMQGLECKVKLNLAEDGFVIHVQRVSGDPLLCRQAEAAIPKIKALTHFP